MSRDREPVEESSMEDDAVARLVGFAGRRPGPSELELGPMKEVLLARWESLVAERRRRSRLLYLKIAAVLVAAVGLAVWQLDLLAPGGRPVGRVAFTSGYLRVIDGDRHGGLAAGDEVLSGRLLSTGSEGRASIRLDGGVELRLGRGTRVRLRSAGGVELDEGRVYVDTSAATGPAEIAVFTRRGTARDLGTRFAVIDVGDDVRVRVRQGRVEVRADGQRHVAAAGEQLVLSPDGSVRSEPITVWGEGWAWVLDSSAGFVLENATLGEFLDWLGAETGWTVNLDVENAASVRASRLHGSLEGLSVEESLELVLASTGLEGQREDGVLSLRPK